MSKIDFALHTAPYQVALKQSPNILWQQVQLHYPTSVASPTLSPQIYDFMPRVTSSRLSSHYQFQIGNQHFRQCRADELFPVFEWGLNWLLSSFCLNYLCIHAAVLAKGEQALIFPAPPGSGKSTLCALLMLEGWRLLSDEHCLVDLETAAIIPCVRPISLKNRSIEVISDYAPHLQQLPRYANTVKGDLKFLPASEQSWLEREQPAKAVAVIFPQYDASGPACELNKIPLVDLGHLLVRNSFNYSSLATQGFAALTELLSQVQGYRLRYRDNQQMLQQVSQLC